jgi:hypothetical protein
MEEFSDTLSNLINLAYMSAADKLDWEEFLGEISRTFHDANILLWHTNKRNN